ncbi:Cold shock-like protein CspA [Anaerolineae bacterium]|nr:Cold shock-like protein CspA [Anaerolineae bacterium]
MNRMTQWPALPARLRRKAGAMRRGLQRPLRPNPAAPPEASRPDRVIGTVKWFDRHKGYGFLGQSHGPDIFVHYTALEGSGFRVLREGQRVGFVVREGPKGLYAADVHPVQ